MKILVAEDDVKLNNGIVLALQDEDITLVQCFRCRECLSVIASEMPEIVILDVNFPDGDGLETLKEIRRRNLPVKVILLTANNLEVDVVSGLELGADDYVTKPFSLMILRSRVRVQMRNAEQSQVGALRSDCFSEGRFLFDFDRMMFRADGQIIELSKTEQRLLRILVQNRGITLGRERLLDLVWNGESEFVDEHALTVTIKRLRDKLNGDPNVEDPIRTIYGIGYAWVK